MTWRKLQVLSVLPVVAQIIVVVPALAFDNDRSISDVSLKEESFLDISAHGFRKSLDMEWLTADSGWRMGGGSVSTDRAFVQTDMRLRHELSRSFQFGLELQHEEFYAPEPFPLPLVFADVYPSSRYDIGLSFLGTPAHDKRQSDLGYALTFGRRPSDYLRLSWLKVDMTYNEKNEFDESRYDKTGRLLMLDAAYRFNSAWQIYVDLEKDTPLAFVFDDQVSRFEHEAHDYKATVIHRQSIYHVVGFTMRAMLVDKHLLESASDQYQEIDYQSMDLYWLDTHFRGNRELTAGLRYDKFVEQYRQALDETENYEFSLETWQAYSSMFYSYADHQAWDIGFYLGWSERSKQYDIANADAYDDAGWQGKLRLSWQYHSLDRASVFLVSMTLNLDDLVSDPGDGGGLYFQTRF